eukprot:scaffold30366_cov20-Prasinocladus_malaysianus.AAC.1
MLRSSGSLMYRSNVWFCAGPQGYYFTGDGCRRDKDGYYWITGEIPESPPGLIDFTSLSLAA